MKKNFSQQLHVSLCTVILCNVCSLVSFAQDSAASASTTTKSVTTTTPSSVPSWAWIIGAIVLIIIIVAVTSIKKSGGHTDKVTYTKTTSSENNP